jgi:hypothetical protein
MSSLKFQLGLYFLTVGTNHITIISYINRQTELLTYDVMNCSIIGRNILWQCRNVYTHARPARWTMSTVAWLLPLKRHGYKAFFLSRVRARVDEMSTPLV